MRLEDVTAWQDQEISLTQPGVFNSRYEPTKINSKVTQSSDPPRYTNTMLKPSNQSITKSASTSSTTTTNIRKKKKGPKDFISSNIDSISGKIKVQKEAPFYWKSISPLPVDVPIQNNEPDLTYLKFVLKGKRDVEHKEKPIHVKNIMMQLGGDILL